MRGDALIGIEQFFQQGVAKQTQLRVLPQFAVRHKQGLPVLLLQSVPQQLRRAQQGCIFIEQGECVSQRPSLRLHPLLLYGERLQAVELTLGLGKSNPTQTIEKIVGVVARGNSVGAVDKGFICLAVWQSVLRHRVKAGLFFSQASVQCIGLLLPSVQ